MEDELSPNRLSALFRTILDNKGTAVVAMTTDIHFRGDITIARNVGEKGGAIYIAEFGQVKVENVSDDY